MFTHITQALNPEDLNPNEHRTLKKIICDLLPDFRSLPEDIEDISAVLLAGFKFMVDVKTLACNKSLKGPNATPVETRQSHAATEYTRRAKDLDAKLGIPAGEELSLIHI